jgi:hypothetical protein
MDPHPLSNVSFNVYGSNLFHLPFLLAITGGNKLAAPVLEDERRLSWLVVPPPFTGYLSRRGYHLNQKTLVSIRRTRVARGATAIYRCARQQAGPVSVGLK